MSLESDLSPKVCPTMVTLKRPLLQFEFANRLVNVKQPKYQLVVLTDSILSIDTNGMTVQMMFSKFFARRELAWAFFAVKWLLFLEREI